MDRVDKLVTDDDDKELEREHVKSALNANGFKPWMLRKKNAPTLATLYDVVKDSKDNCYLEARIYASTGLNCSAEMNSSLRTGKDHQIFGTENKAMLADILIDRGHTLH